MSSLIQISSRGVRTVTGSRHRVPWPNMRRHKGITKTGSRYDERQRWPAAMPGRADWVERQNHYYPEIMPKVNDAKSEKMKLYTDVQPEHYIHPVTGEIVHVPEMNVQIVPPRPADLSSTKYCPYVSYRVETKIEQLIGKADPAKPWPPAKCTPMLLYDMHYRERVNHQLGDGQKYDVRRSDEKKAKEIDEK